MPSSRLRAVLLLALAVFLPPWPASAEPFRFTILYAHGTSELDEGQERGGLSRLAGLIRRERAGGGAGNGPVLALHGGQTLAPSALSFYDQGAHMVDLLNRVGIDAMAVLNLDFQHGDDAVSARAFEAAFPFVTTNTADTATGKPLEGVERAVLLNAGPYRVGVLAATPVLTRDTTVAKRTEFRDPVPALREAAKTLRAEGADLIVAMTGNVGNTHKDIMAAGIADIVLYQDRGRAIGVEYDGRTLTATVDPQAAWALGIDVTIDRETRDGAGRVVWSPGVRAIDTATVTPDPDTAVRVKTYMARLDGLLRMQLGRLETPMDTRREAVRGAENAFANAVADALRAAMEADVALINGGIIRGDRLYEPGTTLTLRDIQTEIPFHDTPVLVEVTGERLREALEAGYSGVEQLQGRFPHLSNARVVVDLNRPAGQRVTELTVGGKPVDPAARYRLAVGSYIGGGGDGYAALAGAPRLVDGRDADFLSKLIADHIARAGSFAPRLDGRLTVQR
ncbi:bifunctional metallophosphatase/5'-nucleotidase [Azospirillum soli]|uniref:bifunctional metallophosphatase/5'-nucleotidase n=1 Tax=Azospirillum soli TaxID=1304799 RepID=UPI001AE6DD84|nr:5'-nucleotidase C-terminal domain-containing protein [Azospirillum soli]MBP2313121.1 2',3'-cyclic-nucleotide 2'-phosphodiesterase (5'-nucleotidase family) [Azospirillum soli]